MSQGTYDTSTFNAANNLTHTLWALAIAALIYVAANLILTPRAEVRRLSKTATSAPAENR